MKKMLLMVLIVVFALPFALNAATTDVQYGTTSGGTLGTMPIQGINNGGDWWLTPDDTTISTHTTYNCVISIEADFYYPAGHETHYMDLSNDNTIERTFSVPAGWGEYEVYFCNGTHKSDSTTYGPGTVYTVSHFDQ